jgi:hypothetical protein
MGTLRYLNTEDFAVFEYRGDFVVFECHGDFAVSEHCVDFAVFEFRGDCAVSECHGVTSLAVEPEQPSPGVEACLVLQPCPGVVALAAQLMPVDNSGHTTQ